MSSVFSYEESGAMRWNGPPTAHHRGTLPNGSLAWVSTLAIGICAGIFLAISIFTFYKWQYSSTEAARITIHPRQRTRPARTRRAKYFARRPHAAGGAINTPAAANVHYVTPIEPALPLPSIVTGTLGNSWTEGPCAAPCINSNTTCPTAACPVEGGGGTDTYAKAMYPPATTQHAAGEVATDASLPSDWTGRHGTSPGMATNAPPSTRAHNSACDTYIYSAAAVQCVTPAEPALPLPSKTGTLGNGWAEGPCAITRTSSNTACLTVDCKAEDRGGNKSYKPNNSVTPTKHDAGDATLDNMVPQGGSPGTASKVSTTTMPKPARGIQPTKANRKSSTARMEQLHHIIYNTSSPMAQLAAELVDLLNEWEDYVDPEARIEFGPRITITSALKLASEMRDEHAQDLMDEHKSLSEWDARRRASVWDTHSPRLEALCNLASKFFSDKSPKMRRCPAGQKQNYITRTLRDYSARVSARISALSSLDASAEALEGEGNEEEQYDLGELDASW